MNLSEHIHIERSAEGDYLVTWPESFSAAPVDIYASTRPDDAVGGELVHGGGEQSARIESLRGTRRHYFFLQPADGQGLTVAERLLPLRGGTNFRDMGGYTTADGRRVKWGRLYRSGHMSYLSDEDLTYLEGLAIGLCCDFRREDERRNEPSRLPHSTRILGLTVDPGSVSGFFARLGDDLTAEHMAEAMVGINREMVRDHQPCYRRMFAELLALKEGAMLINCSAGKDRTGFGAALILAALGVPRETILHDYMLSARYYPIERELARVLKKYGSESWQLTEESVLPMMQTREEYLLAAFEAIDELYGSLPVYLEQAFGIGVPERAELRRRFTA